MTDTASRGQPGTDQGRLDEAKEQVQEKAQEVSGQARDKARGMVDERSTQFGEQVGQQAQDVRSIAEQLREQGKDGPAKMAEQAADRAERFGSYLRDSDGQSILDDVERMARNNPWAVVAGGIAIGFAASRFLKASSRERYRSGGGRSSQGMTQLPRTVGASGSGPYGRRRQRRLRRRVQHPVACRRGARPADRPRSADRSDGRQRAARHPGGQRWQRPDARWPGRPRRPGQAVERSGAEQLTMATDHDDLREQSIGELLKRLSEETSTLVRQELELAKAEATQKGKEAGVGAGLFGGAGVVGLLALGALTAAIILALDLAMPAWLAALIVALVYGAIAGVLALRGRDRFKEAGPPVPGANHRNREGGRAMGQDPSTIRHEIEQTRRARWARPSTRSGTRPTSSLGPRRTSKGRSTP